jgi:SAM-dependent methyltransferase
VNEHAARLPAGSIVLDASAGERPYARFFARHRYESCDVPGGFYRTAHDFLCTLEAIPRPDGHYDAVLLTQVLEHVPEPERVLREIHRVLKPGGQLMLSLPLNGPLHGEPWHFFQFTHHAIGRMASDCGFEVRECEKMGGAFWLLGRQAHVLSKAIMKQVDPLRARERGRSIALCSLATLLYLPAWLAMLVLMGGMVRPLCYWLDRLDLDKALTAGFTAVLVKR